MRLVFTEQGRQVGEVTLQAGRLAGPGAWVRVVETTMRRDNQSAVAALHALDGWSNGYLTTHLRDD